MTSRISPTSGLAADVAIVDALRVVVPFGVSPLPAWEEVVVARGRSGTGADQGSVATRRQASVAARHRGVCCLLIEDCLKTRARARRGNETGATAVAEKGLFGAGVEEWGGTDDVM